LEDENTVLGRQPKMREDLSDLKPAGSDDAEKTEATSINTTGPVKGVKATPTNTPHHVAKPEDKSLTGQQSHARDDLDQVAVRKASTNDKATPINLPGTQATAENEGATPQPIPKPEDTELSPDDVKINAKDGSENRGATPLPIPHPEDTSNAAESKGATPQPIPQPEDFGLSPDDVNLDARSTVGEAPEPGPHPFPNVAIEDEGDGQNVAESPDPGGDPPGPNQVEKDQPGTGG